MAVNVIPLSQWARALPVWLRPQHPPIFEEGEPTAADRRLAEALIIALDDESRAWYGQD
jgi:hypothetical protein